MPMQIRENIIREDSPDLTDPQKALRRLQNPKAAVEELSRGVRGDVSQFTFNPASDAPPMEYRCTRCGLHLRLNWVEKVGEVRCSCGDLEGVVLQPSPDDP